MHAIVSTVSRPLAALALLAAAATAQVERFDLSAWREIGPSNMGGRVVDVAVCESKPHVFYVAYATGGVFRTANGGTTFVPVFDEAPVASIGALAIDPRDPDVLYVGTGEANPRNSVSWGAGVFKTTDGGKSWSHLGLEGTHHVGRIAIDPGDPRVVYVAACGRTWGPGPDRGLYRSRDGGETWERVLFVDDETGAIDVVLDPFDASIVYAASWQRRRDAFDGNDPAVRWGAGSAIWRSADRGETWTRLSGPGIDRGLPTVKVGRVGLAAARSREGVLYAVVETELIGKKVEGQSDPPMEGPAYMGVSGEDAQGEGALLTEVGQGSAAAGAGLATGDVVTRLGEAEIGGWDDLVGVIRTKKAGDSLDLEWRRGAEVLSGSITFGSRRGAQGSQGPLGGQVAGAERFQGPRGFETGGVFRSDDRGESWQRVSSLNPRPFYFSTLRVNPRDAEEVWCLGIDLHHSVDGGRTWADGAGRPMHVDHHAMWIDPVHPEHRIHGSDGGLYATWDAGRTYDHLHQMSVGQFYHVAVDGRRPYHVYGGLQDNGTWTGPSRTRSVAGTTQADWKMLWGGDGFEVLVHPEDDDVVYVESQGGAIARLDLASGARRTIRPPRGDGARFNWNTPMTLSPHDPETLWFGAQALYRFRGEGEPRMVSGDLVRTDRGTLTAVAEDRHRAGLLYAGSDDGALRVSRDGGATWGDVYDRLPGLDGPRAIAGIEPSWHVEGRVYVAVDPHRSDEFAPHVFASDDAGETFRSIAGDLPPREVVRVVREDPRQPDLLYLGTETGAWASLSRGLRWRRLGRGLPTVPVFDLVVHPRDRELVAGTHGRGIWILDVAPIQDLGPSFDEGSVAFLGVQPIVRYENGLGGRLVGPRAYAIPNPEPAGRWGLHLPATPSPSVRVEISILDGEGRPIRRLEPERPLEAGLNAIAWDLRRAPGRRARRGAPVDPGRYAIVLTAKGRELARSEFEVLPDPGPEPWATPPKGADEGREESRREKDA